MTSNTCRHYADCAAVETFMQAKGGHAIHCYDADCAHFTIKPGPKCLKCERIMLPAIRVESSQETWDSPAGGVSFDGGWSFGSTLYDAAFPRDDGFGVYLTVVVCDECIKKAVADGLALERKSKKYLFPSVISE